MTTNLHGVWVAMPTPWASPGVIDGGVVRELVSRYQVAGLHGAYTTGTDGEMHVLDLPEFTALAEAFGRAATDTGLPVQMGCTWSHTDGVIERARIAQAHGVGIVQVALPSWVTLNDAEITSLFAALAQAVPDMAVVHYNIAKSGRFFGAREYRMVAAVAPNLVGSKHTGGDIASLIEIVHDGPPLAHFVVDTQIVPGALFGAKGFYSFLANLSPGLALAMWGACEAGDWVVAAQWRDRIDALFREWRTARAAITASPALGKIATAAGILPEMPLAVRAPYGAGDSNDVATLRALMVGAFPDLVMD